MTSERNHMRSSAVPQASCGCLWNLQTSLTMNSQTGNIQICFVYIQNQSRHMTIVLFIVLLACHSCPLLSPLQLLTYQGLMPSSTSLCMWMQKERFVLAALPLPSQPKALWGAGDSGGGGSGGGSGRGHVVGHPRAQLLQVRGSQKNTLRLLIQSIISHKWDTIRQCRIQLPRVEAPFDCILSFKCFILFSSQV